MRIKVPKKIINVDLERSASIRLSLCRTEGEWDFIDAKIRGMGKTTFASFIHSEIKKLSTEFKECPNCITHAAGRKVERIPWISSVSLKELEDIAIIMQKPLSSVIQEFIIAPLLRQETV
jgi:hypothetical protein